MNKYTIIAAAVLFAAPVFSQIEEEVKTEEENIIITENQITIIEEGEGEPDTLKLKVGTREIMVISHRTEDFNLDPDEDNGDDDEPGDEKSKAHWAGVDLGITMLMNENFKTSFPGNPYFENDPAKSIVWNVNPFEHKFAFGTPFVGLTTGLGFSFTSVAIKNDYIIEYNADSLYGSIDTVSTYSKNKLKAAYLTIPLLLEFNTNIDPDRSFYLAAGVIGGVRLSSKIKRKGTFDDGGKEFDQREKGTYALNPFKLDAAVRLGYGRVGVFANYSLLPMFDVAKTVEVYPLTFGLSFNF